MIAAGAGWCSSCSFCRWSNGDSIVFIPCATGVINAALKRFCPPRRLRARCWGPLLSPLPGELRFLFKTHACLYFRECSLPDSPLYDDYENRRLAASILNNCLLLHLLLLLLLCLSLCRVNVIAVYTTLCYGCSTFTRVFNWTGESFRCFFSY